MNVPAGPVAQSAGVLHEGTQTGSGGAAASPVVPPSPVGSPPSPVGSMPSSSLLPPPPQATSTRTAISARGRIPMPATLSWRVGGQDPGPAAVALPVDPGARDEERVVVGVAVRVLGHRTLAAVRKELVEECAEARPVLARARPVARADLPLEPVNRPAVESLGDPGAPGALDLDPLLLEAVQHGRD